MYPSNTGLVQPQMGVWGFWGTGIEGKTVRADSRIFYVDPNHTLATDAGNTGEDMTVPFATVQAAVDRCRGYRGDVVLIAANAGWQYADGDSYILPILETVEITVPGIKIVGAFSSSSLGVVWNPPTAGDLCITVSAIDVLIEGICFEGVNGVGGNGIYAEWAGGATALWGDNLTVRNCVFDQYIDTAIQLEESWYTNIYNNVFQTCGVAGVMSDVGGSGVAYNRIYSNWFINLPLAISLLGGATDNEIFDNRLYNTLAENGQAVPEAFINTTGGDRNLVHHNTMSSALGAGNGAYDDTCSAAGTDAWIHNYLLDGVTVLPPA